MAYSDSKVKIGSDACLGSAAKDEIKAADGTDMPEVLSYRLITLPNGSVGALADIYLPTSVAADASALDTGAELAAFARYKHLLPGSTVRTATKLFYKTGAKGTDTWAVVTSA